MKKRIEPKIMHESWFDLLDDFLKSDALKNILIALRKIYPNTCPDIPDVFRAFSLPLSEVKCLIIGIGPYSDGTATGLAMATNNGKLNPPLHVLSEARSIYYSDPSINGQIDTSLESWHKQGVMLLNCYLSTQKFKGPRHHESFWLSFTPYFLDKLSRKRSDIIYCLWGAEAKALKDNIIEGHVLEACHPVATKRQLEKYGMIEKIEDKLNFFKFNHFTEVNKILTSNNSKEIQW